LVDTCFCGLLRRWFVVLGCLLFLGFMVVTVMKIN
jgi:hypothetical protein